MIIGLDIFSRTTFAGSSTDFIPVPPVPSDTWFQICDTKTDWIEIPVVDYDLDRC